MRSKARECAFKAIFAGEFNEAGDARRALYKAFDLSEEERAYADLLYAFVKEHRAELSAILDKYSIGFKENRIFPVDRSVLLIALAEILYVEDVPPVVSIDEAVGLVKKYSTEKSAGFVNGLLAAVIAGDKDEHID